MTFPAPAPGNRQTIRQEDKLLWRPDSGGRWTRSSPVGTIDKYYGGKTSEVVHVSEFHMPITTRISGHWSIQPEALSHIRFNVSSLGKGWLDPTSATDFGEDAAFLRAANSSWRKANFSQDHPNNSAGFILNWANGDGWSIHDRTSAQVRFDIIKLNPNYSSMRWNLLYRNKPGEVATIDAVVTLQAVFEDIQSIAFNCDANVIAGAIHLEAF